jgi:hypothetical protein
MFKSIGLISTTCAIQGIKAYNGAERFILGEFQCENRYVGLYLPRQLQHRPHTQHPKIRRKIKRKGIRHSPNKQQHSKLIVN